MNQHEDSNMTYDESLDDNKAQLDGHVKDEPMSPVESQEACHSNRSASSSSDQTVKPQGPLPPASLSLPSRVMYPLKFPCPYCAIRFSNENTLKAHLHGYCTKINREVDVAQQNMTTLLNANSRYHQIIDQMCPMRSREPNSDRPRSLDVPPYAVILEALCHPERLDTSRCFRTGDVCYVAVHLDKPHILSPVQSPSPHPNDEPSKPTSLQRCSSTSDEVLDLSMNTIMTKHIDIFRSSADVTPTYSEPTNIEKPKLDVCMPNVQSYEPLDLSPKTVNESKEWTVACSDLRPDYQCSTCGYLATTIRGLRLHERVHSNNSLSVNREFHKNCSKFCMSDRKRSHSSEADSVDDENMQHMPLRIPPVCSVFRCPQCGVQFSNPTTLTQHCLYYCHKNRSNMLNPSSVVNPRIGDCASKEATQKEENVDAPPTDDDCKNRCDFCNINFRQRTSYVAHKLHYCRGTADGRNVKNEASEGHNKTCTASPTA